MIKKFNDNWNSFDDLNYDLKSLPGDNWYDTYKRAKILSIKKNKNIKYIFNGVIHNVYPKTNVDELTHEYDCAYEIIKKYNNKNKELIVGETDFWFNYWEEKSKDPSFEMDTISEYAKKNGISYRDAKQYFYDNSNKDNSDFSDDTPVLGLPSGQLLYMNSKQIKYFSARDHIMYVKIWKKPISGGGIKIIRLESYCFDDKNYSMIKNMMDVIIR